MPYLLCLLLWTSALGADVYYKEEIVNPGFGAQKIGARKTQRQVFIKGMQQKVVSEIETSKKTAEALKKQGQSLNSSTILRLDEGQVFEIDLESQTFVQEKMPPAGKKAVAKAAAQALAPQIGFAVKETGDTTRVAGILCRRVVAQMRARYIDPKTKQPLRENRYTYDAWIGKDFPGYQEIRAFQSLQQSKTSYPPLISGGLEQLREAAEDFQSLTDSLQVKTLEGFPMRSTIQVSVLRAGQENPVEVFRLEREIKSFAHSALPDSLFAVSKSLTKLEHK